MNMNELQAAIFAARGMDGGSASHLMSLSPSAVHIDRALTNCAIAYKNREYIADQCMPVVKVANRSDKIFEFPVETMQQLADVSIAGNRGMPGEVKYTLNSDKNYSVSDYALMDFVSNDEIANADAPLQPKIEAVEIVTNFLQLARESRVSGKVFGSSNYGANTAALAGADRWDTATSDPVQKIEDAIESCFVRPTHLVLGAQVWTKLRNHPKFLQFILSRASTSSGATPLRVSEQLIADAFGLEACIVGRAKAVTSVEGQTVQTGYLWGKSAALIRVEQAPSPRKTQCFGYTFRFGSFETREIVDNVRGVRGGVFEKVSHSDAETIIGGVNAGFLYTTVVS